MYGVHRLSGNEMVTLQPPPTSCHSPFPMHSRRSGRITWLAPAIGRHAVVYRIGPFCPWIIAGGCPRDPDMWDFCVTVAGQPAPPASGSHLREVSSIGPVAPLRQVGPRRPLSDPSQRCACNGKTKCLTVEVWLTRSLFVLTTRPSTLSKCSPTTAVRDLPRSGKPC